MVEAYSHSHQGLFSGYKMKEGLTLIGVFMEGMAHGELNGTLVLLGDG